MPTSIQSGKKPMECRKMRDCRPKLTTAKWRDNEPVSAAFTSESHLTFIKIKKTPDMNNDSKVQAVAWELPEWVMRNILPEKEIGTGLVYVNVPGTLKEATTQEALQRGTGPKPAKISVLRDPFLYLYLAISLSLSLSLL